MSSFPNALDNLDTSMTGTTLVTADDHAQRHRELGSAINTLELFLGTNSTTDVFQGYQTGWFPLALKGGTPQTIVPHGTFPDAILGTPTITGGNFNNLTFGSAVLQAPTINGLGTNSGTLINGVYNNATLGTPTLQGAVVNTANVVDAAITSRKLQLQYFGTVYVGANFTQTTSGGSWYNVTNLVGTISPAVASVLDLNFHCLLASDTNGGRVDVQILYNGTVLTSSLITNSAAAERYQTALNYMGTIPSGAGTIQIQVSDQSGGNHLITLVGSGYNGLFAKYWSQ